MQHAAGLRGSGEPLPARFRRREHRTDPDFIKSQDGRNTTLPARPLFTEHFLTFEFSLIHSNRQKKGPPM
ncbi:hypothetical protein [Bradyrhizobium sp. C9]|uniref:hypothetical protein n=1 Tax=Bradyrhizobium sp. C9 TaxID=142585 RepID=UPI001177D269|nr:hypothetical protein [Bradyrhizobium sp. C9]